jgi:hypothetical protein
MSDINQVIANIMDSPSTSTWLRNALRSALSRDCVDAANDAELLATLLRKRTDYILGSSWEHEIA